MQIDGSVVTTIIVGIVNLFIILLGWSLRQQHIDLLRRVSHLEAQVESMKDNYLDRFDGVHKKMSEILISQARMETILKEIHDKCSNLCKVPYLGK